MRHGNALGHVCVCMSVLFESLHLETSFLVCRYFYRVSRSSLYMKVIGSRSRSQEEKRHASITKYDCMSAHLQVMHLWLLLITLDCFIELNVRLSHSVTPLLQVIYCMCVNTGRWRTAAWCLSWQSRLDWCQRRRRWLRRSLSQRTLNSWSQLAQFHCSSQPTQITANTSWNTITCCSVIHSCFRQEFTSMNVLCFFQSVC